MKYFVMINDLLMTTVEADSRKEAEEKVKRKTKSANFDTVAFNMEDQQTIAFREKMNHCKIVSMEELSLMYDGLSNAALEVKVSECECAVMKASYNIAKHRMDKAEERLRDARRWYRKQAEELGLDGE